jgi:nucleoporin NUP42
MLTFWNTDADTIARDVPTDLNKDKARPKWIFSSYGPTKVSPVSLMEENEYSSEEIRLRYYQAAAQGNAAQADQEAMQMYNKIEQDYRNILNNVSGITKFLQEGDKKRPNRHDFADVKLFNGSKTREQFTQSFTRNSSSSPFGGSSGAFGSGGASAFGAGSSFGNNQNQSANPFSRPAASTFGQSAGGTSFGAKPAFGQSSTPAFGQSSTPAFGQSSTPAAFGQSSTSAFGQLSTPSFGQSSFGKPAAGGAAFGQPAFGSSGAGAASNNPFAKPSAGAGFGQPSTSFGQPSQPGTGFGQTPHLSSPFGQNAQKPAAFGQPSQPTSGFGQKPATPSAFGQPSQPTSTFGQPSQPSTGFGQPAQPSAFGQPAQPSNFGQPSQPSTGFGQPAQPAAFGQPAQPSSFGQPAQPSSFGQPAQPSSFGQPAQPSAFGQPQQPQPSTGFGQQPSSQPQASQPAFGSAQSASPTSSTPPSTVQPAQQPHKEFNLKPGETAPLHYTQTLPKQPPSFGPNGRLQSFRGQRVAYVQPGAAGQAESDLPTIYQNMADKKVAEIPVYLRPSNRQQERIWFPEGDQVPEVVRMLSIRDQYEGAEAEYTEEVKGRYEFLLKMGRFRDGVVPLVPPVREMVGYDF